MNYYNEIKSELINNEVYKKVKDYSKNRSDLNTYYKVGKMLNDAGKHYGEGIIKEYSRRLTNELGKGYNSSSLKRMRQFYNVIKKGATMSHQLSWSYYVELLKFENISIINYYIDIGMSYNLSVRELRNKIKNKEYDRLSEETKNNLINKKDKKISDFIKNPIIIRNSYKHDFISEKILKQLILEDLDNFMKELGEGFCYIESEYKIKIGDRYNYIDLLLFNYKYNCFVVIELKITELKSEYIGQIQKYMNYINKNIKDINQDKTIGIIICKKDNKFVMEYASDNRIYRSIYELL